MSDIYRPENKETLPVLLMRQPYGREIASTVVYAQPEYFARAGFIVIIQDVRGRGDSEGTFYPFINERQDGHESIKWAANLVGSDGRVCMYGFSYQAYTQLAVLEDRPAALIAIAPHMSAADLFNGWFYQNGILRLSTTLSWGNQMLREDAWRCGATESATALEKAYLSGGGLAQTLPVAEVDPLCRTDLPSYAKDWLTHPQNGDFWKALDCSAALAESNVAVFHLAGYYDYYSEGSTLAYQCRKDTTHDFFLLAPWKHIPWERWMSGIDFGPDLRIDTDKMLVDFFNAQLGRDDLKHSGARYFVIGENKWRSALKWPPESSDLRFHLSSQGNANSSFGDGVLLAHADTHTISDHFVYDPTVPVTAPGGMSPEWGPVNLQSQQQSNSLLVYDTEKFETAVTIAGHAELVLQVDTTAVATDFVARLSWLRDDGSALFLAMAAASTNDLERESTGAFVVTLKFAATAITLSAGEALRLDIASSAFPLLARHPNTMTDRAQVKNPSQFLRARQTVLHDRLRPSILTLPVIDRDFRSV